MGGEFTIPASPAGSVSSAGSPFSQSNSVSSGVSGAASAAAELAAGMPEGKLDGAESSVARDPIHCESIC